MLVTAVYFAQRVLKRAKACSVTTWTARYARGKNTYSMAWSILAKHGPFRPFFMHPVPRAGPRPDPSTPSSPPARRGHPQSHGGVSRDSPRSGGRLPTSPYPPTPPPPHPTPGPWRPAVRPTRRHRRRQRQRRRRRPRRRRCCCCCCCCCWAGDSSDLTPPSPLPTFPTCKHGESLKAGRALAR